jgi:hypothetical protein
MLTPAGVRPIRVTITAGKEVNHTDRRPYSVPKRDLVAVLQRLLAGVPRLPCASSLSIGCVNLALHKFLMLNCAASGHATVDIRRRL